MRGDELHESWRSNTNEGRNQLSSLLDRGVRTILTILALAKTLLLNLPQLIRKFILNVNSIAGCVCLSFPD
jgi:hypothetical protein